MRRLLLAVLLAFVGVNAAYGQTPATYTDRAKLRSDPNFIGRIEIAVLNAAIAVVLEDPAVAQHEVRAKLAGYALREPEFVSRRLATLIAATATAQVDTEGTVTTPLTDAQLLTLIQNRWTLLSTTLIAP